jgi:hypothetical protein
MVEANCREEGRRVRERAADDGVEESELGVGDREGADSDYD